jgi:hypothetical protein
MKHCTICNIEFANNKVFSNHVRWKHKKVEYKRQTCPCCSKSIRSENFAKHKTVCKLKQCKHCKADILGGRNVFCNSTCSAAFNNEHRDHDNVDRSYITEEWKNKQSNYTKTHWNNGLHSPSRTIFSSKKEREIVKHFKEKFVSDEWKSGGRLKLDENVFLSRDLWSDKLKICFEYDGIWHFKDIKGQLKMKQYKDALLEEWCLKNNYRLIRVDENCFKNVSQIELLIYNSTQQVVKIGERY